MEFMRQFGEFVTQVLTFLIFYWVMKRFAWPALMGVLDKRQRQIEDGFAQIERKQAEAEKLHLEYEAHLRNIEQEARARIQEAVAEGRRVAAEIGDHARQEARKTADRAQRNMEIELAKARAQLREEIITLTLAATERLLREKLDAAAHRGQVARFLQDLESEN